MITEGKPILEEHEPCVPWVKTLHELYLALKKERDRRGVFEIEAPEVHFLFDKDWQITGMEADERNDAHKLIEECMIAANICAATFVKEHQKHSLYRIHERPSPEKLEKLRAILSRYGIDLAHGDEPTPLDFKHVAEQVQKLGPSYDKVISLQMLRSMSKACYSPDNVGHFGLALENYAHFTSPIRRYPDLQLHRVIKDILEHVEKRTWGKIGSQPYTHEQLVALGQRCSEREIAADAAEFDVDNSLKCQYLKNFEGEAVDGIISTVSEMGVFVTLKDFYIDGMIPSRYLAKINAACGTISFEAGVEYGLGEQIKVRVAEVDCMNRFITLLPIVELRKSDKKFDLQERMAQVKGRTQEDLTPDNTIKDDFFARLSDISRGKEGDNENAVTREHISYSIADQLNTTPVSEVERSAATASAAAESADTSADASAADAIAIAPSKGKKSKTAAKIGRASCRERV